MKYLLTLFTILIICAVSYGQVCNPPTETKYERIDVNQYKVTMSNECDLEHGHLKLTKDDKLIRHGIFKTYCKGKLVLISRYKNGKNKWTKIQK